MAWQGGYEQRIEVICKIAKKMLRGPVQGMGGGQSGCEHRIEVIVKIQKIRKKVGVGSTLGVGGARRIEVIVKMHEKSRRVRSWPGWM